MKSISYILMLFIFLSSGAYAGELNCNVSVNSSAVQSTNKQIYESMRKSISEFMNNTKWTEDEFSTNEKIECTVYITINENPTINKFSGHIQVQSVRPVYNSSYNSPLFNHLDKEFSFDYIEFQTIEIIEGTFTSNLASVLAYYAYVIIGFDYDSYSKFGGSKYFQKALDIVNTAQGKDYSGWDAMNIDKNNRYWLINQLMNKTFQPLRETVYQYHRLGLDVMYDKLEGGRSTVLESLKALRKVNREEPNSFLLQVFFDTKRDEISKMFSGASSTEIDDIKMLAAELDASNSSKYFEKR